MTARLVPVTDDEEYLRLAEGFPLPAEQAPVWDRFDTAVADRRPWGRLAFYSAQNVSGDRPDALVSFTRLDLPGGLAFLWAKLGPVWRQEPTAEQEADLRRLLVAALRRTDPRVVFARMHVQHEAGDVLPMMRGITYDQTVVVTLGVSDEELMASLKKRGRRDVRKALRDESLTVSEETGISLEGFRELYTLLEETGERGGYGVHPAEHYHAMMDSLGPEHARLFVTRRDGRPLSWGLVTVHGEFAAYSWAASNAEGRSALAADAMVWLILTTLNAAGVRTFDMGGAGSERYPGLNNLTQFKTKFNEHVVPYPAARDIPARPALYRALGAARTARHGLRSALSGARDLPQNLSGAGQRTLGSLRRAARRLP